MKRKWGKPFFTVLALLFLTGAGVTFYMHASTYRNVIVRCPLKEPVDVALVDGQGLELPFMLLLDSLDVTLNPLKLLVVHPVTGKVSREKPNFFTIENGQTTGRIAGVDVIIHEYIPAAKRIVSADTITYISYGYVGGVPAVRMTAVDHESGVEATGWVSHKNFMNPNSNLSINQEKVTILPRAQITDVQAKVLMYHKDKEHDEFQVTYKKSGRVGRWKLSLVRHKEWEELVGTYAEFRFQDLLWLWLAYIFMGLLLVTTGIITTYKK